MGATVISIIAAFAVLLAGDAATGQPSASVPAAPLPAADPILQWRDAVPQGTGPAKVTRVVPDTLKTHTLYWPANWSGGPIPIIAFSSCRNTSLRFAGFLSDIASHGYFIIALGNDDIELMPPSDHIRGPNGTYVTPDRRPFYRREPRVLTQAVDWAVAENGRAGSPYRGKLDTGRIAYMGQSCGAGQALSAASDPRTTTAVGSTPSFAMRIRGHH